MPVQTPIQPALGEWLRIVRGEYSEIPGLNLTKPQVQRLWGLDPATCDALLEQLLADHFLRRTSSGSFARADFDR
jgi:hypothetical protein